MATRYTNFRLPSFTLALPLALALLSACSSSKNGNGDETIVTAEVKTLTSQDSYPGVESNLKYTRNYRVEFSADIKEEINFTNLLVDSVKLPVYSLTVDGDVVRNEDYSMMGNFLSIAIQSPRHFYQSNPRITMVEEQVYALSGQVIPEGKAILEYDHFGTLKYIELGDITKLKSEYHP